MRRARSQANASGTRDTHPRLSLRRRILVVGGIVGAALLLGGGLFLYTALDIRDELNQATDAFLQEQRIANGIGQAVMRQLATGSAITEDPSTETQRRFRESGDEVYDQIRRYLFLDLSSDARAQLERMREEHQRLEVLAARTADLLARGEAEAGAQLRSEMLDQAFVLLDAVDDLVLLRDAELEALRGRQDQAFRLLFTGGMFATLLAALAALLLALLLHRRVTQPLSLLSEATDRLGKGELATRLPPGEDREFDQLSRAFNRMAEELEGATHDLEERNRELSEALDQIRTTQNELIQTEKLSAMGRMAAGLAHELNNPLASVLGFSQLLEGQLLASDALSPREALDSFVIPIVEEASRAQHLVRNFLHFSRQSQVELGPVHLPAAVEVIRTLRDFAFRQAGFELRVETIPEVHVHADPNLLQSVFVNLVNNALQALSDRREAGGALVIRASRKEGRVHIVFEDDGPGLTDPERIFEPFYTTKPVGEGTGLGLAVAHRFMESFGGRIEGENRLEGGARFTLTLLAVEPVDPTSDPATADAPGSPGSVPDPIAGCTILVVEDEAPLRTLQDRILRRMGAEVLLAADGAEARRILQTTDVDLVISDVRMPGESGLDLFRWILRERTPLSRRFLFVTGDIGAPELISLAERWPGTFLHKPFEVEEYLGRVRTILRNGTVDRLPAPTPAPR